MNSHSIHCADYISAYVVQQLIGLPAILLLRHARHCMLDLDVTRSVYCHMLKHSWLRLQPFLGQPFGDA